MAPLIEKRAYAPQKCLYLRSSSEPRVAIGLVVRCKHVGEASDLVNTTAEVPKPFGKEVPNEGDPLTASLVSCQGRCSIPP